MRRIVSCLFYTLLLTMASCSTTSYKDQIVDNSNRDLGDVPLWSIESKFKKYKKEEVNPVERKNFIYLTKRRTVKVRSDLDLCFKFARVDGETEFRQGIGNILSDVAQEVVSSGGITEQMSNRVQEVSKGMKVEGPIAGVETNDKYWQKIRRGNSDQTEYECFVLLRLPKDFYDKQVRNSLNSISGLSKNDKKKMADNRKALDNAYDKVFD